MACHGCHEGIAWGVVGAIKRELHAPCAHRAKFRYIHFHGQCSPPPPFQLRFIMSLSWVTLSTDVFYNRASTGDRVPAIVLGSSPQPGDFLRIQYEVGGKVVVHEAAALHRIEFQIRSPSPSPSLSPPQHHEDNSGGPIAEDGGGVATTTDTLVYQQGPTRAELGTLGRMKTIRPTRK